MKFAWLILFILIPFTSYAQVYKTVDEYGQVTYSDKPTSNKSVPVDLPKTNSSPSTTSSSTTVTTTTTNAPPPPNAVMVIDQNVKKPYTKFLISAPADQETLQNQPTIPVKIDIQPELQQGDVIQVYLDGAPWGNAEHKTEFEFTAPDRGTHVLSATLFDKSMRVLKQSNSNTIFVHKASLGPANVHANPG